MQLTLALLSFMLGFGAVVIGPMIPPLKDKYHKPSFMVGLAAVMFVFGNVVVYIMDPHHFIEGFWHHMQDLALLVGIVAAILVCSEYILIVGDLIGTPFTVVAFGIMSLIVAAFFSTGGAAVILGRLLARTLQERERPLPALMYFSIVCCNIAGGTSSLGDGPLMLLPSRGVDFWWATTNLTVWTLVLFAILTVIYLLIDGLIVYPMESKGARQLDFSHFQKMDLDLQQSWFYIGLLMTVVPVFVLTEGWIRIGLFWGIAALAFVVGHFRKDIPDIDEVKPHAVVRHHVPWWFPVLELGMVLAILIPTTAPMGMYLSENPEMVTEAGIDTPMEYYVATAVASESLDNAPASLIMIEAASAQYRAGLLRDDSELVVAHDFVLPNNTLKAIEAGAVHGGALTLLGNFAQIVFMSLVQSVMGKRKRPGYFKYLAVAQVFAMPVMYLIAPFFLGG